MKFFEHGGWWLPDGEEHLQEYLTRRNQWINGRLQYQRSKFLEAMKWVVGPRRLAVDVGAHAGLWSMTLAEYFDNVVAFEPVQEHAACWQKNMEGIGNAVLFPIALGERAGTVRLKPMPGASMKIRVYAGIDDVVEAPIQRLDDLTVDSKAPIDFLKIDVEGYEYFVCRGGEQTLLRSKPVVIVEQKPATGMLENYGIRETEAVLYLESLGAKQRVEINGDYVLSWDSR